MRTGLRTWSPFTEAALLALALLGCARSSEPVGILLVSFDTMRADHTSLHGYARNTTPTLERTAREGAHFEIAYAPSSTTAPTHATLFTGVLPIRHGVVKNGIPLGEPHRTLAEHLADQGFQTAAFVSSYVLNRRFGFAQGFSHYDDEFSLEHATVQSYLEEGDLVEAGFDRRAAATTDRVLAWLEDERDPKRPFFLFLHYFDPHHPYAPPASAMVRFPDELPTDPLEQAILLYDAEIAFADHELGRVLERVAALGLERDTLVVITADHGEGLMQHGIRHHGLHLYEEAVRVPLVVRWPARVPAGHTLEGPVSVADLVPTVLALAGLPPQAGLDGQSLAEPLLGRGSLSPDREIFFHRRHFRGRVEGHHVAGERFGIRSGRWKYIAPEPGRSAELYDLIADPGETRNLNREHPERSAELEARIGDYRGQRTAVPAIQPEEDRRLRALGYVE